MTYFGEIRLVPHLGHNDWGGAESGKVQVVSKDASGPGPRRLMPDGPDRSEWIDSLPRRPYTPPVDDATYPSRVDLLAKVIDHYLTSREFNGLPVGESSGSHENAVQLIRDGQIQLVTTNDYMNTHIRPWAKDDWDRQTTELLLVARGELTACLYPTKAAMGEHRPNLTHTQPYRDRMSMGGATLELVYFELAAIEGYVNDPRFEFNLGDAEFSFATAVTGPDENESDPLSLEAGYAYDHSVDYRGDAPIRRYWTAFLHDLVRLPQHHQMRLSTFERDHTNLFPHPDWWDRQMGNWIEVIGPFTKILWELKAINDLWTIVYDTTLFGTVTRPRAWGWVLRATTGDWNNFIQLTDKLLSDNLRSSGLDAAGAPKMDDEGNLHGSITRLQEWILSVSKGSSRENVRNVLQPFRDVRKLRQNPAHKLEDTVTDPYVVNRQRDLLRDVAQSLNAIRSFMAGNPQVRASDWKPPTSIDNWRWL